MNTIVYVLILIAAMTISITARMPSTVLGARIRAAYSKEMAAEEQLQLSIQSKELYKDHKTPRVPKSQQTPGEEGEEEKENLDEALPKRSSLEPRISFLTVVNEPLSTHRKVFYTLLELLFNENEWYQQELVDKLLDALEEPIKEKKPNDLADLSELKLENPELQKFLKKILRFGLLNEEGKSPYLLLTKTTKKLSLYLAEEKLLLAIFGNQQDVVDELMERRRDLWKRYKPEDKKQLTDEFESHYRYQVDDSFIDFGVSGSKPPGP